MFYLLQIEWIVNCIILTGTNFGTKADRILVVGAHWDTVANSPGKIKIKLQVIIIKLIIKLIISMK